MIAVWMAYALVSGALIGFVCWLLEHIARAARVPTRFIWAGGMVMMLVIPALAMVREAPGTAGALPAAAAGAPAQDAADAERPSAPRGAATPLRQKVAEVLASIDSRLAVVAGKLSPWDGALLGL